MVLPESDRALLLRSGVATNPGRVRSQNQDRYLIVDQTLFLVADGMGGHVGGEVAAQVTVDTLRTLSTRGNQHDLEPGTSILLRSEDVVARIEAANLTILQRADDDPDLRGMGTTLTGLAVIEGDATSPALLLIVNVGDSRTYWLRGGELEQLSEDHSVVGELQREGKLSASEARTHKSRSVLTRALGVEPNVECDVLEVVPIVGDRFLICSDGLPTELADATIASTLRRLGDPGEAAAALVRDAVDHGGRDNVTVIVVDVVAGLDGSGAPAAAASPLRSALNTSVAAAAVTQADSGTAVEPTAKPKRQPPPKGPRRPWIVNLRVLIFLAAVAALAAGVVWTLRNAPAKDEKPVTTPVEVSTTIASPETTASPAVGETGGDTTPGSTPVRVATPATDASLTSDLADPVPGAVVDPFATTTVSATTTNAPKTTRRKLTS